MCAASAWREAKPEVKSGWTSALRASDIIVFAPAEHDRAVLGERARDLENRLLRIEQNGRAHVRTPVTNAQLVCRLLLEKKQYNIQIIENTTHDMYTKTAYSLRNKY